MNVSNYNNTSEPHDMNKINLEVWEGYMSRTILGKIKTEERWR